MPLPIQRVPRGFLELLNALVAGEGPHAFEENLRPTLEMREFYGYSQNQSLALSTGAGVSPFSSTTVPRPQWWLLFRMSWTVTPGAAAAYGNIQLELTDPGPSVSVVVASGEWDRAAANAAPFVVQYCPPSPILLAPTSRIIGRTNFNLDAATVGSLQAQIGVLG